MDVSRARARRFPTWSWRVELVPRTGVRHPPCFGGIDTPALAERTAATVRELLRLPAAPAEGARAS